MMPIIHNKKIIARSRLFQIEALDLEFANQTKVQFERITSQIKGAVMIVAINEHNEVALVKEYAVGSEQYELTLPKGAIDAGEDPLQAANRELAEEIGFCAAQTEVISTLKIAPAYFKFNTYIVLAQGLTPKSLTGDEPEPLEVIYHPLDDIDSLLTRDDFSEARSIAALFLAQRQLLG